MPSNNGLDYGRAAHWLKLHPEGPAREAAKAILRNIQRIPEALFENAIYGALAELTERADPKRPLLAASESYYGELKSNHWLIDRARAIAPNLLADGVFSPAGKYGDKRPWMRYQGQDVDLFFIDDASYSGTQMSELILAAYQSTQDCGVKPVKIYVALGCASIAARRKIAEALDRYPENERPPIVFLGKPVLLPTLTDLVAQKKLSPEELATIKAQYRNYGLSRARRDTSSTTTLSYPPHKIPDEYSILEYAFLGAVPGAMDRHLFIPETTPSYKHTPEYEAASDEQRAALCASDSSAAVGSLEKFFIQARKRGDYFPLLINYSLNYTEAPLILAAKNGHTEVVKRLLAQPGIDVKNDALLQAVSQGHTEVMELLLIQPDIDVNRPSSHGQTALIAASENNDEDSVKALLAHPAIDVNRTDKAGKTALHHAAVRGKSQIVEILLATPGIDPHPLGAPLTPLSFAVHAGHQECAELLLAAPTNDTAAATESYMQAMATAIEKRDLKSLERILVKTRIDVNAAMQGRSGRTLLTIAAGENQVEVVRFLLKQDGIDLNKSGTWTDTPMVAAIENGAHEVFDLLYEDDRLDINRPSGCSQTPLGAAIACGDAALLLRVLRHPDVDVNKPCQGSGKTAMEKARKWNDTDLIEVLRLHGARDVKSDELIGDDLRLTSYFEYTAS